MVLENDYSGTFISIEGIDGCGKTTVGGELSQRLLDNDVATIGAREPTQFVTGNWVRESMAFDHVPEQTRFFALLADRAYNNEHRIKPMLEDGEVVLCDRYADSTRAYQWDVFGENRMEHEFVGKCIRRTEIVPDVTLYLRCPPGVAMERNDGEGRYEDRETLTAVHERYEDLCAKYDRIHPIDAEQSIDAVVDDCMDVITDELMDNDGC